MHNVNVPSLKNNNNSKEKGDYSKTRAIKFIERSHRQSLMLLLLILVMIGDFLGYATGLRLLPSRKFPSMIVERFNVVIFT